MKGVQQQSAQHSPTSAAQAGAGQREASDSVRGAVRGMSFDEGAAALAPVQRKAVQRSPGGSVGGAASSAVGAANTGASTAAGAAQSAAPAAAPAAAPGAAAQSPYGGDAGSASITAGTINLNAPMVQANGVLRASTIIADTVIGSNYTPGAGNLM